MKSKFKKRKRRKSMSEVKAEAAAPEAEVLKERVDTNTDVELNISRPMNDSQTLLIYIRAPMVANIIRAMTTSNYEKAKYAPIYAPILKEIPESKGVYVQTKAAVPKASKNFVSGTDFSFTENPRAILLANPEALEQGYTLTYKVEQPVPMDTLKRWGKLFLDGCEEIITNAKPFKMSWVMTKEDK